jgi:WXXGXW repeat (2 copies)
MRCFHRAFTALLIGACAPVAFGGPAFAQTCACAPSGASEGGYLIQADEPPPPLPEYGQPPIPSPGYYWTPGYWAWNNYDYYWVPGVWVEPPQPGLLWTPGFWAFAGGVYAFNPGYWGPHVGYYGGINYGFGYNGLGYQGGRWDSGRFFYNTTVNNIGAAHITNVYTQNVVNNTTINNTSFNGGQGGVVAKPTSEEMLAAKEPRVRATAPQIGQARAAGMRSEQFVSTNRGKPAIAATARPGEFKGKGVVPARAAGKAAEITAPAGNVAPAPTLPANAPKPGRSRRRLKSRANQRPLQSSRNR